MSRLVNPWPVSRTINARSPYGYRIHPITGKRTFHHGVDVGGTFPVTAAASGRVQHVGWNAKGGGHTVLIDHGDIVTVYYHGRERTRLQPKQHVDVGNFIYTSGNTGASTGAHLHFEVRRPGGKWGDTMDPAKFLPVPGQQPQPVEENPADGHTAPLSPILEPDILPQPQPVPRPPQNRPTYNRPITADHLERLRKRFHLYPKRGWFQ